MKQWNAAAVCGLCLLVFAPRLALCAGSADADSNRGGRIRIGAMNGPTMMGLGKLFSDAKNNTALPYTLSKEVTPDAIVAGLANRTFDAACLPANNAAILFNNAAISIKVAAINTLNVLYVLQKAGTPAITSLEDLAGKTVYMPGQGSTPEFAFRYLLSKNNIPGVRLEFETEGSTIAAGLRDAASKYDYAVLPQPAASVAASGQGAAKQVLSLTDEWKKFNPGSDIVTGVLVVREDFLVNNRAAFDIFLADYRQSVAFMSNSANLDAAAGYVVDMGIVPQAPVAKNALPKCGISFVEKTGMKDMLVDFYTVLYGQNPASVGGKLPDESFYYF